MTQQNIGIKYIKKTCECYPSQWEAKLMDGRMLYIRYRWGVLSIRASLKKTDNIMDAVDGKEILGKKLGAGFDGYLDDDAMKQYLKTALERLTIENGTTF